MCVCVSLIAHPVTEMTFFTRATETSRFVFVVVVFFSYDTAHTIYFFFSRQHIAFDLPTKRVHSKTTYSSTPIQFRF